MRVPVPPETLNSVGLRRIQKSAIFFKGNSLAILTGSEITIQITEPFSL